MNRSIRVYVVRSKSTGKYMPPKEGKFASTRQELSDRPRIFFQKYLARWAAAWWVKGRASPTWDDALGCTDVEYIPDPDRNIEDLEIVPATIAISYLNSGQAEPAAQPEKKRGS